MAYVFIESRIMPKQSVASTASTAAVPVGTIARAKDSLLGEGEFIYLATIASVKVGALVMWTTQALGSVVTAIVPNTANNSSQIAVGMVNGVASTFAWFQIAGTAPVLKQASVVSKNIIPMISTTTGRIRKLSSIGRSILGMRTAGSTSATFSTVLCTFNRPHLMAT